MSDVKIITNNVPRDVLDAYQLTPKEREEFDYLDWDKIDEGSSSASFVRYKGHLYYLGEFSADYGISKGAGLPAHLSRWDAYMADSAFSAVVIRWVGNEFDQVIVGLVLS